MTPQPSSTKFNSPATYCDERAITGKGAYDLSQVPSGFEIEEDFSEITQAYRDKEELNEVVDNYRRALSGQIIDAVDSPSKKGEVVEKQIEAKSQFMTYNK